MNDLGLVIFPQGAQAARIQREYLTHSLQFHMGTTKPDKWANRFQLVNSYQEYFPLLPEVWSPTNRCPRLLDEEEKISILLKAAPPKFYRDIKMQGTNSSHFKSVQSAVKFLTQLHEAAQFEKKMHEFNEQKRKHGSDGYQERPKKRYKGGKSSHQHNNNQDRSGFKKCSNCGKSGHLDPDCWYKEENQKKQPPGWGPSKDGHKNHKSNRDYSKSNKHKSKTGEAHMMNDAKLARSHSQQGLQAW